MLESKTPKFNRLIDKVLSDLEPHFRNCALCKKDFEIETGDIVFLKMFKVPPSKFCPSCRERNRLSFVNYSHIYKRKCDFPGHTEIMISPIAPVMPWIVYDQESYYSDAWDPMSYGVDVNTNESFFDQFLDLLKVIPQSGVRRGINSINSDFNFYGKDMKDCYYVFGGRRSEDVMFSSSIYDSRHVIDSYFVKKVDTVFENIRTTDSFKTKYAYFSSNCIDCDFIFDCRNCQNCFGCVNLRNKNYCWFNVQLSKEEYQKRKENTDLGSRKTVVEMKEKFWRLVKDNPIRATRVYQSQNVSGDDIIKSNNCQKCFQVENSENLRYVGFCIVGLKDSMDVGHSGGAERIYYSQNTGDHSSNVKFSFAVKESVDCEYMMTSKNCQNCFGCIGIDNASFLIFNKQYNEEDYWKKLDEIKSLMLMRGEYGEFFPFSFSPIAYNSSFADTIYGITEKEKKELGVFWQEDSYLETKDMETIMANDLPDNIKYVDKSICGFVVIGEVSKKPFKLTEREMDFYKKNNISLPTDTPYTRMIDRFKILNDFKIYEGSCFSCKKNIESSYRAEDGYKPYCEECFQREVL